MRNCYAPAVLQNSKLSAGAEGQLLEGFLHNHHKNATLSAPPERPSRMVCGSPFSALGRILQECEHDTGEVRASSFVTIHSFDGPLFPSKGNRLHFLGFLARKAS